MFNPARSVSMLVVFFCIIGVLPAADEPLSREAVAKRAKAATVFVDLKTGGSASAFCVHEDGLFVTNEHVVRQAPVTITLVLNAGQKNQRVLRAAVIRRDKDLDLAVLKVDGDEKFEPVELGSDKGLSELTEVIACGFPFGHAIGLAKPRDGEYPSPSINVGTVTSLRHAKDGDLDRIQLDAALNPGNSGGPVLDRSGKVVGMVVSGIRGSGVNMAIPVSHLHRFLSAPDIVLTVPSVKVANRHDAFEFTAKPTWILPPKAGDQTEVELVLVTDSGKERRFPMKLTAGLYRVKAIPFPAREGPALCEVAVKYDGGSVNGTTEDRSIRIGENEMKLHQVRNLKLGSKPEALLRDGKRLDGKLTDLETLAVKVGNQVLKLDLASAVEINVDTPAEVTLLSCSAVIRQGGQQMPSSSVPLFIEGLSRPKPSWTLDLKEMVFPDTPLTGTMLGVQFTPENIQMNGTVLTLRGGNNSNMSIFLHLKPGQEIYEFSAEAQQFINRPHIHIHMVAMPGGLGAYTTGYAMRLQFGKEKNGKIPGKLYLCLPDDKKSFIAGSFNLTSP